MLCSGVFPHKLETSALELLRFMALRSLLMGTPLNFVPTFSDHVADVIIRSNSLMDSVALMLPSEIINSLLIHRPLLGDQSAKAQRSTRSLRADDCVDLVPVLRTRLSPPHHLSQQLTRSDIGLDGVASISDPIGMHRVVGFLQGSRKYSPGNGFRGVGHGI